MSEVRIPEAFRFLFDASRYKVAHGGRGSGKSWQFARALLIQGAQQPLRILCAREVQKSIADSVHKLLGDQIEAMGLDAFYSITETAIRGANGTEFAFAGLRQQSVTNIKSFEGVDRCWVEEAQTVSDRSWSILTPTIRKPGSEIWVTFNPELDSDATYRRFIESPPTGSVVRKVNFDANPWFPPELEDERQDTLRRDPDAYANIWLGEPKTVVDGAIYGKEIIALHESGRVRDVPYDPLLKVHTFWDLGWNDSTAIILAQRTASEVRIIDYIEDSHKRLDEYVSMLAERRWNWGDDYVPHDAKAKNYQTGKTTEEALQALGRNPMPVPNIAVEQGIQAARMMFGRVYMDRTRTAPLLNSLKRYRRHIPVSTGTPTQPVHDESSHGADAFRYMALAIDRAGNQTWKPLPVANTGLTVWL